MNSAKNPTNLHAIFTSVAFEMENAIRMRAHSRSCYHNTLARLEDEIAMNSIQLFRIYMKIINEMNLRWTLPSNRDRIYR